MDGQRECQSSSSSSVQSGKMIGYQKARLALECFVCFGGFASSWKVVFASSGNPKLGFGQLSVTPLKPLKLKYCCFYN